ncbi:MAG: AarF/ABC1/UbiB kinase family protein, partial [Deltaproteobacteria bacterium]|nr:AarF/ABC1/UbiB kinase family protein [Deltaproteobacteria bacterium]
LNQLIEEFEQGKDGESEERFYRQIFFYWERIGALPGEHLLYRISQLTDSEEITFGRDFDRMLKAEMNGSLSAQDVLLAALRRERFAEQFLDELNSYALGASPSTLLFREEVQRILPPDAPNRDARKAAINEARRQFASLSDRLEISRFGLPSAFLKQPPEILFLLKSYIKNMPEAHVASLLSQMHSLGETASDAEVFNHFFLNAGLAKVAQFLSTMAGIVPDADRLVFARLQDDVPASSSAEVRRTVERELQVPIDVFFKSWDDKPVASASMGEIYRAVLRDESVVYVKVLTSSKEAHIRAAIRTLERTAKDWESEKERFSASIDIAAQIRSFVARLKEQMDYTVEKRHAFNFVSDGIVTPRYLGSLSTPHLMIMRPVMGKKITRLQGAQNRALAARVYVEQAVRMLFKTGQYHADPHPGNVFWDETNKILSWLDWGIVGKLSLEGKTRLIAILMAVVQEDTEEVLGALRAASAVQSFDEAYLRAHVSETFAQDSAGKKLAALLNTTGRAKLYLDDEIMHAIAFLLTVDGVSRELDPAINIGEIVFQVLMTDQEGEFPSFEAYEETDAFVSIWKAERQAQVPEAKRTSWNDAGVMVEKLESYFKSVRRSMEEDAAMALSRDIKEIRNSYEWRVGLDTIERKTFAVLDRMPRSTIKPSWASDMLRQRLEARFQKSLKRIEIQTLLNDIASKRNILKAYEQFLELTKK